LLAEIKHIEWFLLILPLVAFLYASVGHGGASGYLGLMALFSFPTLMMKPTALLLNLFVAAVSFYHYYKQKHFQWKLFYPFIITSVPAAFLGGYFNVDGQLYKKILGVVLVIAILKLLGLLGKESKALKAIKLWQGLVVGGIIGLVSGMIGIGGGIILSPIILLMKWGEMKTTAATSALFIWVNSAAAMLGFWVKGSAVELASSILVILAFIGGLAGAYFGSRYFHNKALRYILATVLVSACIKLFLI